MNLETTYTYPDHKTVDVEIWFDVTPANEACGVKEEIEILEVWDTENAEEIRLGAIETSTYEQECLDKYQEMQQEKEHEREAELFCV